MRLLVCVADAKAWAAFTEDLRREIADRIAAGHLSDQLGAPAHIERDLEAVLDAIRRLPSHGRQARLDLGAVRDLSGWLYYVRLVSRWVQQLHEDGLLHLKEPEVALRFERDLIRAVSEAEGVRL